MLILQKLALAGPGVQYIANYIIVS